MDDYRESLAAGGGSSKLGKKLGKQFAQCYYDMRKRANRERKRGLKRLVIELTIEEAARCLAIARNKKVSRKRWLQQIVRKELEHGQP